MTVVRCRSNPIIHSDMDGLVCEEGLNNINGPSLIRVPDWVGQPLGRYYLYFAHHRGSFIRMAYADELEGPWRLYTPGVLPLGDSFFDDHVASPDVHVDEAGRELRLYYHGQNRDPYPEQPTRVAFSRDGLHFRAHEPLQGPSPYWRVFHWQGAHYALAMPGKLLRSDTGVGGWEAGPQIFPPVTVREINGRPSPCGLRHMALRLRGEVLEVYHSNRGDCPERILRSSVKLAGDWRGWRPSDPEEVLAPELAYEGADEPHEPSRGGLARSPVWQLRDPGIYEEDGRIWLLYSVAGEQGIGLAELRDD